MDWAIAAPSTSTQQSSLSSASANLALLQPFEKFGPKKESRKYYFQLFQNFLEMKKVTSNK
jgi:hypothetical protein